MTAWDISFLSFFMSHVRFVLPKHTKLESRLLMRLTFTDSELALIKENFLKQVRANGYQYPDSDFFCGINETHTKLLLKIGSIRATFSTHASESGEGGRISSTIEVSNFFRIEGILANETTPENLIYMLTNFHYRIIPNMEALFSTTAQG